MTDTDSPRPQPLYPLHGVPCVVCGIPAAGVVRTEGGVATAHYATRGTQLARICPHPPTGRNEVR